MPARKRAREAKRHAAKAVRGPSPTLVVMDEVEEAWSGHGPCADGRHCPCGLGYCCSCGSYDINTSAEEIAEFRNSPASQP